MTVGPGGSEFQPTVMETRELPESREFMDVRKESMVITFLDQ